MARRPPVGFLLAVLVAGFVLFLVPSAWLHARGVPYVLCWLGGALAFPLLPVGWHLLAERRRTRAAAAAAASAKGPKPAASSTLTGGDRFVMRLALVALVALGPLVFFRFGQTWRAVRDHATWFVPEAPPAPRTFKGDPRVLDQVPSDAEVVLWVRNFDGLVAGDDGDAKKKKKRDAAQPDEVLVAFRDGELLLVVRGPEKALAEVDLDEANRQLPKQDWLPIRGKLVKRARAKDLLVVVTEGWAQSADDRHAGTSTGPTAIIERLGVAPADAVIISAASPSRPIAGLAVNGAQSWLRVSKADIRLDGEVFVSDQTAATAIAIGMRAGLKDLEGRAPGDCKATVSRLLSRVVIDSGATSVRVSARWKPEEIGEAMMCGFAAAMQRAEWKKAEAE